MPDPNQFDLFGTDPRQLSRSTDPSTSHAAAHSINTPRLERKVLEAVAAIEPCISAEVVAAMGLPIQTVTPRFAPLKRKGLITSGPDARPSASSKRAQKIHRTTEKGRAALKPPAEDGNV